MCLMTLEPGQGLHALRPPTRQDLAHRTCGYRRAAGGGGGMRNRRNLERQILEKRIKVCKVVPRHLKDRSHFSCTLPLCPRPQKPPETNSKPQKAKKEEITATDHRHIGMTTNVYGICFFLHHNLGILYQITLGC